MGFGCFKYNFSCLFSGVINKVQFSCTLIICFYFKKPYLLYYFHIREYKYIETEIKINNSYFLFKNDIVLRRVQLEKINIT